MKVVWITGGGTGIGRALAELFYKNGYRVAISGRRVDILTDAAKTIATGAGPGEIFALPGDISDLAYVDQTHQTLSQLWGPIDILINNAAINPHQAFKESTLENYRKLLEINTLASIYCSKKVLEGMQAKRSGSIVNISSFLGKWASAHSSAYCVSKFALAGFTDALRLELKGDGIHVMGVYPGFILTPMTEDSANTPFKRRMAASPEKMAAAIWRGIQCHRRDVYYPGYVRWMLALHHWIPGPLERLYQRVR